MEALPSGHAARLGASRICAHLVTVGEEYLEAVAYLTGRGLEYDLCCWTCDKNGQAGQTITWLDACEGCVDRLIENDNPRAWRGEAGVRHRAEAVDTTLVHTPLPDPFAVGLADFAAMPGPSCRWLLLDHEGLLVIFDAESGRNDRQMQVELATEPAAQLGHAPTARVHVDPTGRYAALVHDYGQRGLVVDLRDGRVTMALDRGRHHPEQTPFPAAFLNGVDGVVLVHATEWNRLDVCDPSNGRLLTDRHPSAYLRDGSRPERYLDYFHGELLPSPDGQWIADDGWVWSPFGVPRVWNAKRWLEQNVWESEAGDSMRYLTQRAYYWGHPICWVAAGLLAVSGIGTDDEAMLSGVRIFDVATGQEIIAFACPTTALFADPSRLYTSSPTSLQVWDPRTGELTATIGGFAPSRQHAGAKQLAEIKDGNLVRWQMP